MNKRTKTEIYASPEVRVIDTELQQIICTSGVTLGDLDEGDESW